MAVSNFASIQMFRAVAANAVVLSHLTVIEIKYSHGFVILPQWFGFAGSCGVYFFFVISGAVMGLIAPRGDWRQFLLARVLRIYPIYWIYTSAVLAVFLVMPGIVNTSYQQQPSILKSYLLWPQEVGPLLVVGWTLIHEIYFYLVIAAMLIVAVPLGYGLAVWALIVVVGYLMLGSAYGPVLAVVFNPMTLQFILGACVGLLLSQGCVSFDGIGLIAGMIGFLVGAALHVAWGLPLLGPESVVLLGLPFVLIVYGGAALELRGRWRRL